LSALSRRAVRDRNRRRSMGDAAGHRLADVGLHRNAAATPPDRPARLRQGSDRTFRLLPPGPPRYALARGGGLAGGRAAMSKRCLAAAVAVLGIVASASAQDYPSRPLTMIVPYPAGGVTDGLARLLAERMKAPLGQTITVENVGGAAGSIGVGRAVRAAPDGYTFLMGN